MTRTLSQPGGALRRKRSIAAAARSIRAWSRTFPLISSSTFFTFPGETSWPPQHLIMIPNDPQADEVTAHLEGHAIVYINAGFPETLGSLNGLDLQGGIARIRGEERELFIDFALDGTGESLVGYAKALIREDPHRGRFSAASNPFNVPSPTRRPARLSASASRSQACHCRVQK